VPVVIEFDVGLKLLRGTYSGVLDDELLIYGTQTLVKFANQLHPAQVITDLSPASFKVSPETVRELASRHLPSLRGIVRVIVAASDLAFGMARMFEIAGAETCGKMHVVRTMQQAYDLLKIKDEPNFEKLELDLS
jgi:hypothetical protein